ELSLELYNLPEAQSGREVFRLLHALKGVAATVGAARLAAIAASAERLPASEAIGQRPALVEAANAAREAALAYVAAQAGGAEQAGDSSVGEMTDSELRDQLNLLAQLLARGDVRATAQMDRIGASGDLEIDRDIAQLRDAVGNFDFSAAERLCVQAIKRLEES
ncbi:MAG: Hpt domain-containing protein, partial [Xanthomonadales bacterium]|nr:Hpt domain-containing protein [Xanthomonadales bacterium]